jgi:dihydroorotate dehydrogenase subfamily 1
MPVDLRTRFCGLELRNPIIVAAGVHGRDGKTIKETSRSGVAAVCTKTIVSQPARDVLPCFARVEGGMLNAVFGTDKTAEYWFTEGIKEAKEGDALVIANLAGFTPEESAELARKAETAGADVIELPTHCPHMGEILNAMFPGMNFPEPKLTDTEPMKRAVQLMKSAVKAPVVVKLSGTFSHIAREWALAVKEAGADAVACSDAFGPAVAIDIRTGQPALGGPRGAGGLTGPAIKPLVLRMVLDIALAVDLPIVGVGGVAKASDAVEYLMAGATLVGVVTAGHLEGPKGYTRIIGDLGKLLAELGARGPSDVRGLTLKRIAERKARKLDAVTTPVPAVVEPGLCTGCGICVKVCAYGAASVGEAHARGETARAAGGRARGKAGRGKASIDPALCIGCGLCVSSCPEGAIRQSYYG